MYKHISYIRVRYCETDQMGYLHHANYAKFYEEARTNAMRDAGYSYKQSEQDGIIMPVVKIESKFIKPAFYDDNIEIHTLIKEVPRMGMFIIHHEWFNPQNILMHTATVTLAVIKSETNKRCELPDVFLQFLKEKIA